MNTTIAYENHDLVQAVDLAANSVTPRPLEAGLHLISLAVTPRDTAIQDILVSIAGKHSYVAGFDQTWGGARTYVDSLQEYSDLHTLDGYHGYWLRTKAPGDLVVYGSKLHDDVPVPVKAGWNLISYLPVVAYNPDRALASVRQHVSVVGGFDAGAQTYVPGSPLNDLIAMKPGLGYWLYSTANAYLDYRAGASGSPPMVRPAVPEVAQTCEVQPVPTRQWMDLYGGLTVNGRPAETGTIVSIADEEGVICGTTIVRTDGKYGFLHAYADDPLTSLDEGAVPGESLSLLIDGRRVYGAGAIVWQGRQAVVRADLDVSLTPTDVSLSRPLRFGMEPPHPNPFNPSTRLRVEAREPGQVEMKVWSMTGQLVFGLTFEASAGLNEVVWDGTDRTGAGVGSGVYLCRVRRGASTAQIRLLVVR